LGARFGLSLQASVGIATGYARVGRLGSEDSKDYTAIGDVVNLAARLQGKAGAGEILIGEESYTKHSAEFPEATSERLLLKGFREPDGLSRHGETPPGNDSLQTLRERTSWGRLWCQSFAISLIGLGSCRGRGFFGLTPRLFLTKVSSVHSHPGNLAIGISIPRHARKLRMEGVAPAMIYMVR
jgi:hypothetical protein